MSSLWPKDEFIDQLIQAGCDYTDIGGGPDGHNNVSGCEISQSAGLPPIPDSPLSPILHERGPNNVETMD